ncbi:unnamed protein product [Calypogeia fissa]
MYALEKLIAGGAIPLSISDSRGCIIDEDGFGFVKLAVKSLRMRTRS